MLSAIRDLFSRVRRQPTPELLASPHKDEDFWADYWRRLDPKYTPEEWR